MRHVKSTEYQRLRQDGIPDLHNIELLKACKNSNELLGELLTANRDFIFSIIMHFKGSIEEIRTKFRVSEDELYQHACIGIITALNEFDFERGVKFTTYVVRPILWEINQLLYSDSQAVRLSRGAVELIKKMVEIEDALGYRPNEDELARLLDVTVERYREIAMFSDELEHYDALENFDIEAKSDRGLEEEVTNRIYVEDLLKDSMFSDFEIEVMNLILKNPENNNAKIAAVLNVYPMTISRTLAKIRTKINGKEHSANSNDDIKNVSKYEREISIVAQGIKEKNSILCIEEIIDLLNGHGIAISNYSTRILYYIRQKAIQRSND